MRKNIDSNTMANMARSLDNAELGAAVRILTELLETRKPVALKRVATIARASRDEWEVISDAVLAHFNVEEEAISHVLLDEAVRPESEKEPRVRVGQSLELPLIPAVQVPGESPTFIERSQPDRTSIKGTAFDVMVKLFTRVNLSVKTAQSIMANLLKHWPEGDVYAAISQASRQDFIANPQAYITAYLKANSEPVASRAARRYPTVPAPAGSGLSARKPSPVATPDRMGVSKATSELLEAKRRSLRIDLGASVDDTKPEKV